MPIPLEGIPVCYLCGGPIDRVASADHVPPKQFFGHEIRKRHPLSLLKIPTHRVCNHSYKLDEEYFVHSLAPIANRTYATNAVLADIRARFKRGEQLPLGKAVLKEFQPEPSGLILPGDKVAKRFVGRRIGRVLWKIVRGLNFYESGEILPAEHQIGWEITPPGQKPSDIFAYVAREQSRGPHQGIFAYKFVKVTSERGCCIQVWALLLWDNLIFLVYFHDPITCRRANCKGMPDKG